MIKIYPVEVEAVDDAEEPVFKLKAIDAYYATLTIDLLISHNNIDELCQALRQAVALLKLEPVDAPVSTTTD